jgi:hypothetical protein
MPPQCSWACDDPVCDADCKAYALPPQCECVGRPDITPTCYAQCSGTQDYDACPTCEVVCNLSSCPTTVECEQLEAYWACRKPSNCPQPTCQLQCEHPACEYTGPNDPWATAGNAFPVWAIVLLSILGVWFLLDSLRVWISARVRNPLRF